MTVRTVDGVHEVLMKQLPGWFKPVLEYIAIMQGYAAELSRYEGDAEKIGKNFFLQTCDLETIRYWERLLRLSVRYGDTEDFRRERIIQKLSRIAPYTVRHLKDRLTDLFGTDYTLEVNPASCRIKIFVTSDRYGAVDLLYDVINDLVPAHLYVYANQEVSNYIASDHYTGCRMTRTFEQTIAPGGN